MLRLSGHRRFALHVPYLTISWTAHTSVLAVDAVDIPLHGKSLAGWHVTHIACRVSDVMTADPLVVRPETNIEAAARILLQKKVRRLPVVDETGRLIGMFTRGDVIKAALRARKAALEKSMAKK